MPVTNIGLQIARDLISGQNTDHVDSVGFGTSNTAEAGSNDRLGDGGGSGTDSYWKTGGDVTITTSSGTDDNNEADPWAQWEAEWTETEISGGGEVTLYEMGTARNSLAGTNPGGNDGSNIYTRKRIGGTGGIGKTNDIRLAARIKVTY